MDKNGATNTPGRRPMSSRSQSGLQKRKRTSQTPSPSITRNRWGKNQHRLVRGAGPRKSSPSSPQTQKEKADHLLQPTFQMTWAMSLAVFTVSTTFPRSPVGTSSSSSS